MNIDTQAYFEAVEPPTFTAANGKTYVGNVLSFEQVLKLQPKLKKLNPEEINVSNLQEQMGVIAVITDSIFPKPVWKFWERKASYWLMKLQPHIMFRVFFGFLAFATNPEIVKK